MNRPERLLLALAGAAALAGLAVVAAPRAETSARALTPGRPTQAAASPEAALSPAEPAVERPSSRCASVPVELDERPHCDPAARARSEADTRRVAELLGLLESAPVDDPMPRRVGAVELAGRIEELGGELPPELRARLLALVTTAEPSLRELMGNALGKTSDDGSLAQQMLALLDSPAADEESHAAALAALAGFADESSVASIARRFDDPHYDAERVARTLAAIGGVEAAGALVEHLAQAELAPGLARELEHRLAARADERVLSRVALELASDDARSRCVALDLLGEARSREHVVEIRALLAAEADPAVRAAGVQALGAIGGREAVDALVELGRAPEPELARRASLALSRVSDRDALENLAADWQRLDDPQRHAVLAAASRCDELGASMREAAERSLESPDARARQLAARVLERAR